MNKIISRVPFRGAPILTAILALTSMPAMATAHFSLSGSHSESNAGYEKIESGGVSGGLAFDLGEYFRLGYTYRQELQSSSGYTEKTSDNSFHKFESSSHVTSHSIDLTIILYGGDIFTPYIFGGGGPKTYNTFMSVEGEEPKRVSATIPAPNGGFGLGIRLNEKFSLKLSYTMSLGVHQVPDQPQEKAVDNYSQVGLSYSL